MKHFWPLTRMRIQLTLRNKMFLFFSLIMPLGFFFLYSSVFARGIPQVVAYFLGPVIALTVMGGFWGLSTALVTYREQGILRRFHVTPVTAADMLASSVAANFILTIPTVLIELLLARLLYHVQDFGNLTTLAGFVVVGTISFAAMGLIVASVTNTMQETQVINQLIWLPLIFLSGATFPFAMLPSLVKKVALFLPATYLVQGLQQGIVTFASMLHEKEAAVSLVAWAMLAFFIASQLFRWEPEEKVTRNAKLWALATIVPFILLGAYELKYGRILVEANSAFQSLSAPSPPSNTNPH